jgi:repressor LexA
MESVGSKLRRKRLALGLTQDELAGRTGISKPYLSLIETGRTANPPADDKLRRLEMALGFPPNELISQAHLERTPRDVRAMLQRLLEKNPQNADGQATPASANPQAAVPVNLDDAYSAGVLQELVESSSSNVERVASNAVPVINRVSAGYPRDFTDLSYPPKVADAYISCPDLNDENAFAARVYGDSMAPKYNEGDIVVFAPNTPPRSGDDCFVRFDDGETTFKRVFFETGEAGASVLRLQPRNEKYRPQVVRPEQVAGLYKAVYKYQRVDD